MARSGLSGLPPKRPVETALTYLPGVSRAHARAILDRARIDPETRTDDLDELQLDLLRRLLRGDEEREEQGAAADGSEAPEPWLAGNGVAFAPYLDRVRDMLQRYLVVLRPWERSTDDPTRNPLPAGAVASLDGTALRVLRGEAMDAERLAFVGRCEGRLQRRYDSFELVSDGARRFDELRAVFGLSDLECDLLWVLLAPELVPEFLWLYRALFRDTTRAAWGEDFLLHAVDPFATRHDAALAALSATATLQRYGLLRIGADEVVAPRRFRVAPFVTGFLLGLPVQLDDLPGALWHRAPGESEPTSAMPLEETTRTAIRRGFRGRRRFLIQGPARAGALRLAREAQAMFGEGLLEVRLGVLLEAGGPARIGHVLGRARLARAGVFFSEVEAMDRGDHGAERLAGLVRLLEGETTTMWLHSRGEIKTEEERISPRVHLALLRDLGAIELPTAMPSQETRADLWRERLESRMAEAELAAALPIATVYRFGVDEIDLAVNLADARARQRNAKKPVVAVGDIEHAARQVASSRLQGLASRIHVRGTWETTVLLPETKEILQEMVAFGRQAGHVLDELGYGRTMGYGRALTALFSGPSGTGKTLCAGLVARDLGLELFRVDLANVVSKYIGETEERLSKLFDASEEAGVALLFDEADSLFAKRTDVQSSVDRYANLEVNYLLQRLEEHDGVVILTSNHPDSIDNAFLRRIRFKPAFPAPDVDERERLWRVMIPPDAPQEAELKFRYLAEDYELTGGQVQNAVLRAAVWAAEAGKPLSHALLGRAAEREYKDMGRVVREYPEDEETVPVPAKG